MHDRRNCAARRLSSAVALASCIGLLTACSRAPEDPGASTTVDIRPKPAETNVTNPTTMRVTLRFAGDAVEVVSAQPKRGNGSHHDPAREAEQAVAGQLRLFRYRVLDAAGAVLATGLVSAPLVAVAEYPDPAENRRIVREEETLSSVSTAISIPYSAAMRAIELAELQPQASVPAESWPAQPARRVELPAGVVP
jgi:hypothetical protein